MKPRFLCVPLLACSNWPSLRGSPCGKVLQRILASKVQPEDREAAVRANIMRKGRLSHAKSSGSLGSALHRAVGKKPRGMAAAVAEAQAAAKQKKAARWKKVTSRGAAAPPVPPLERQGSQAAEDDAEGEDDYVFEMETSRKMPRQPCVPDVRSAFAFAPPPPMARQQGGAHGRSGQGR